MIDIKRLCEDLGRLGYVLSEIDSFKPASSTVAEWVLGLAYYAQHDEPGRLKFEHFVIAGRKR